MKVAGPGIHTMRHGYYLTVGPHPKKRGHMMAICSDGSPQLGHTSITVLTLESVRTMEEAQAWFQRVTTEQPWNRRQ